MPVAVQAAVVYVYFALLGLLLGYMLARPPSYFAQSLFWYVLFDTRWAAVGLGAVVSNADPDLQRRRRMGRDRCVVRRVRAAIVAMVYSC